MVFVDHVGCPKRQRVHEIGMVEHNGIRNFNQFSKNVATNCSPQRESSNAMRCQSYASRKFQSIGQFETNLVRNVADDDVVSNITTQDSIKNHNSAVFVPECNNDFESENETDSDYNPWNNSGNYVY